MGPYIILNDIKKEDFLLNESETISIVPPEKYSDIPKDQMLVTLIDNGYFTAAGIAYNENEYLKFTNKNDTREKVYCLVKIEKLLNEDVSDLKHYLK